LDVTEGGQEPAFTAPMRSAAAQIGDLGRMQAWAGQSAALARAPPNQSLVIDLWDNARRLLPLVAARR
jgi:nitronate monooxygenase